MLNKKKNEINKIDEYNLIATNLELTEKENETEVILITSPTEKESREDVIINLANSLAQNRKVLVIDCNYRYGNLSEKLGFKNKQGFSEIILNKENNNYKKYIETTTNPNLDFISKGEKDISYNTLDENIIKNIIDKLKQQYKYIILSSAHVNELSDALILSKIANKNILIVEDSITTNNALERSIKAFKNVNEEVTGIIYTNNPKK